MRKATVTVACVMAAATLGLATESQAQRERVLVDEYDLPLGLHPVEPASEVFGDLTFVSVRDAHAELLRLGGGVRLGRDWELYGQVPLSFYGRPDGLTGTALGNVEVLALFRALVSREVRFGVGFGGYVPTAQGRSFEIDPGQADAQALGMYSTGNYETSLFLPGYMSLHVHAALAWTHRRFTLSLEGGTDLRLRVYDTDWDAPPFGLSLGSFFAWRVARVISVGGGLRWADVFGDGCGWYYEHHPYCRAGQASLEGGVRLHAGAFQPGFGVLFGLGGPLWDDNVVALVADIRGRW